MKRMAVFVLPLLATIVSVAVLLSCGAVTAGNLQVQSNSLPAERTSQILYAFNDNITAFQIGSDGKLSASSVQTNPFRSVRALAAPSGRHLFRFRSGSIVTFAVQPSSGRLRESFSTPLPHGDPAVGAALNSAGTLLVVWQEEFAQTASPRELITTFAVNPAGRLDLLKTTVLDGFAPLDLGFAALAFDPAGRFLYAGISVGFSATILQLRINADGDISVIDSVSATLPSVWSIVLHPSGKYLYQGTGNPSVGVFSVDQTTGKLMEIQTTGCECAEGPDFGRDLMVSPRGTVLFQITGQNWGVAFYTIDQSSGELTPVPSSFISEVGGVDGLAVDTTARFLYVAGSDSGVIEVFGVSDSGQVISIDSTPIPARLDSLLLDTLKKP